MIALSRPRLYKSGGSVTLTLAGQCFGLDGWIPNWSGIGIGVFIPSNSGATPGNGNEFHIVCHNFREFVPIVPGPTHRRKTAVTCERLRHQPWFVHSEADSLRRPA
jgi:hypothetical protein